MQACIAEISKDFSLSEKQIITLLSFVGLCHDSARKHENADTFDKQSQENCYRLLRQAGISKKLALIFSYTIAYKDEAGQFNTFLLSVGVSENQLENYQYIRVVLYLADCLDIMRCTGQFMLSKVYECLAFVKGYSQNMHGAAFIELTRHIHHFIYTQQNMLFACHIILPSKKRLTLPEVGPNYSLSSKVKVEHADNVLLILLKSMRDIPYFETYLSDQPKLEAKVASCTVAFNPHIHGTTNLIFSTLEQTNNTLLPAETMLVEFKLAPMGGEIESRGLEGGSYNGKQTCFGRMRSHPRKKSNYTLDKIVENYATTTMSKPQDQEAIILDLKKEIARGYKINFDNATVILIYLSRAKQLGIDAVTLNALIHVDELIIRMNAVKQVFFLFLLLDKYVTYNIELFKDNNFEAIKQAIIEKLTVDNLSKMIITTNLDLQHIYNNPMHENLNQVLDLLNITSKPDQEGASPPIFVLTSNDVHTLSGRENPRYKDKKLALDLYHEVITNSNQNMMLQGFMLEYISGYIPQNFFKHIHKPIVNRIQDIEKCIDLLGFIVKNDDVAFTARQQYFINHGFPVILLCEDEEKINMIQFSNYEHRTSHPLKLGYDIKTIATDKEENRLVIMKYLEQNHIYNVKVVLFFDLFTSQLTKRPPQSPYTHQNGFPRLSWLAARACTENKEEKSSKDEHHVIISHADEYNKLNF